MVAPAQVPIYSNIYDGMRFIHSQNPAVACKKGVIHIGAHRCEEAKEYTTYPKVLWIDANDDLCAQYPQIVNAVISEEDDKEIEFIITNNDAMSSSILELKDYLIEHPTCLENDRIKKTTITLDSLLTKQNYKHDDFDLLVMDIQGAELHALKGALKTLPNINTIVTEVSTKELYKGCVLLPDLDAYLDKQGFVRIYTYVNRHCWGDAIYVRKCVSVVLSSGLGNRLFQLAFLYAFAKDTNSLPVLYKKNIKPCSIHFKESTRYDRFYDIFKTYESYDPSYAKHVVEDRASPAVHRDYSVDNRGALTVFEGYFQSEKYFEKHKTDIKCVFSEILRNYAGDLASEDVDECFIHIRGRDHVLKENVAHNIIDIEDYYVKAIANFSADTKYTVFTDDIAFANRMKFLQDINYKIDTDDELKSLYRMSKCRSGNVCTNSTFSWWGSYLSNSSVKCMPYPYLKGFGFGDIYPADTKVISTNYAAFDSVYSIRLIKNKVLAIMLFLQPMEVFDFRVNGVSSKITRFTKDIHKDIYHDYYVIETLLDEKDVSPSMKVSVSINHAERSYDLTCCDSEKKYDLVAMTLFKDDAKLIDSYVAYYEKLGVEHFYMYYNGSLDSITLPKKANVTFIEWNYRYFPNGKHCAQISALTDFLYWSKSFSKYVLFNDLDEYIRWDPSHICLKQFVLQNEFDCYSFMNTFIALNGIVNVEEAYKKIESRDYKKSAKKFEYGQRSKCIVNATKIDSIGIHKIISPDQYSNCCLSTITTELLHVCNFQNRKHVSVSDNDKRF